MCDLGGVPVGTTVTIDYRTRVRDAAPPFATEPAATVIAGDQTPVQPAASRTATAYTAFSGAYGPLRIDEQATAPTIARGGDFGFVIPFGNRGPQALAAPTVVNVLPFNGDGAIPGRGGSGFHGTPRLAKVMAPPRATETYTSAAGTQIGRDRDGTLPAGYSWCAEGDFGQPGCPAWLAEVTAFRVVGSTLAAGAADGVISVRLTTLGNECGDTYVSNRSGGDDTVGLPVESRDAVVSVGGWEPPPSGEPGPSPAPGAGAEPKPLARDSRRPRLSIDKSAARRLVRPGRPVGYRITVRNRGRATAREVRVCDHPSPGLAIVNLPASARMREARSAGGRSRAAPRRAAHAHRDHGRLPLQRGPARDQLRGRLGARRAHAHRAGHGQGPAPPAATARRRHRLDARAATGSVAAPANVRISSESRRRGARLPLGRGTVVAPLVREPFATASCGKPAPPNPPQLVGVQALVAKSA